eukprot:TRINITY_DN30840_c0_g1_i1.p1 TRINITY_DN30840_c0_g1~~TRINITY_DN30840_c0_g1_i1.p1  ORF type:complete len:155 (+),score=10.49 TRINITY_DN30840_c0_g1_i1:58-465(+)
MSVPSDQSAAIIAQYKRLRAEQQALGSKIGELEIEAHEHNLVIQAVEKLDGSRRCYRLVGGVLVERTVAEVLPAVQKNRDGIRDIIKQLREQFIKKGDEVQEFSEKYKIRPASDPTEAQAQNDDDRSEQQAGVLV